MKQYLKRIVRSTMSKLVGTEDLSRLLDQVKQMTDTFDAVNSRMLLNEIASTSQGVQQLLSHTHRGLAHEKDAFGRLLDSGFRCFSQNDEDGVLLHIFSLIGTTNKKVVEICAGDCVECNSANLIINHGWIGLLFDGDEKKIALGKRFYARCRDTFFYPPTLAHAWVTAENVNDLVSNHRFSGDIDLLSLDMDGMDFWVWKALTCIRPRVVVLEINARWGPHKSVTLPYQPDFRLDWDRHPWCQGASLSAFVKLGRQRGYRLVGTHRLGVNAVFLRSDIGADLFPEVTPLECYQRIPVLRHWKPEWIPPREERPEWHDVVEI
ncbi:MAG: hypothetical protein ACYC3I_15500 [Gemmataceae bacterium]